MSTLTQTQTIGLLALLSQSVAALAQGKPAGWTRLSLRNWGGEGENYKLRSLDEVFHSGPASQPSHASRHVKPDELDLLAQVLWQTAQDIQIQPSLCTKTQLAANLAILTGGKTPQYSLAVSDRETEFSGAFTHLFLGDLLNAALHPEGGLQVRVDGETLGVLDFSYNTHPIGGKLLERLADPRAQMAKPARKASLTS